MSDTELKNELKKFLRFIEELGIVEETGQTYKRVSITTIFDKDKQELYTMLENLKSMSE